VCYNGGTCESLSSTDYTCHCSSGYTGNVCQQEVTTTTTAVPTFEFSISGTLRDMGSWLASYDNDVMQSIENALDDFMSTNVFTVTGVTYSEEESRFTVTILVHVGEDTPDISSLAPLLATELDSYGLDVDVESVTSWDPYNGLKEFNGYLKQRPTTPAKTTVYVEV
jgi:predicted amino acid-binding ACT domain protein